MDFSTWLGIAFLVAGALVTLSELHTLTVYLLVLAAGLFAAGALALAGGGLVADLVVLALILILGLPAAHWWRGKLANRAADEVTQDDVGRHVTVLSQADHRLRVSYRGSTWDAHVESGVLPAVGAACRIIRREGNVLVVTPLPQS